MLFELPGFEHIDAGSLEEVSSMLGKTGGKARILAGGTDLLGLMKDRVEGPMCTIPKVLINIKKIPEMTRIDYDGGGMRIGAGVTLSRLAVSEVIQKEFQILSQAALQVATTPLRNVGTLGGNLCQRPRCVYFRHPHFLCFKKGGTRCYAVAGEHRFYHSILRNGKCVMAHPSDLAPALVALNAEVKIMGPKGGRKVPLQEFFTGPNASGETILQPDEFLTEVMIPGRKDWTHQVFLKERIRDSADFALASVAIAARLSRRVCDDVRIVLGGVAPLPYVATKAEETIKGRNLDEDLISKAAEAAVEGNKPLPMNGYKVGLAKTLIRRGLSSMLTEKLEEEDDHKERSGRFQKP